MPSLDVPSLVDLESLHPLMLSLDGSAIDLSGSTFIIDLRLGDE